jgi:PAS domain S-box-containing protein
METPAAWIVISATALYTLLLFGLASTRDEHARSRNFSQHPLTYALALGVYCTSWTFFGAVGTAVESGWNYLPIYLGPIIVFVFASGVIARIARISKRESITSLSDFLSARYGKSRMIATLATSFAVIGSLPYIALQLKSVGVSFQTLMAGSSTHATGEFSVILTAIALAIFAMVFGTRHADNRQQNFGLMRVLAFEAIFKLLALGAVAILALVLLAGADPARIAQASAASFGAGPALTNSFVTITLLSMAAIICLPRQFHVAIIAYQNETEVRTARWAFPVYLGVTALVVIPITLAGLTVLSNGASPDLFVMELPLSQGQGLLALFVFLGGFSAATGMVIVSTIALSSMVTNDLVLPSLVRTRAFSFLARDAGTRLILLRRIVICVILSLAYGYYHLAGNSAALAATGLLSFAAVAQFAPALIGGLYWRGARRDGAIAGLVGGMAVWAYCLLLPVIIDVSLLRGGVWSWIHPQALLGSDFGDPLTHGVVWSLGVNIAFFIFLSLRAKERLRDRVQANAFTGGGEGLHPLGFAAASTPGFAVSPHGLHTLAARFLPVDAVDATFAQFANDTGEVVVGDAPASWPLIRRTEKLLASAIGASSARIVMSSAVGGEHTSFDDVLAIIDQQTRAAQFDRSMLQSMLENIAEGIAVVDAQQRLIAWNSAYCNIFDYPDELVQVGEPIESLIAHNVEAGWIGGDAAQITRKRLQHMRAGLSYRHERQGPDGRWLRLIGNPIPGGGYLTTFSDITEDKQREQELLELNDSLEQRVEKRTAELARMAAQLEQSRRDAEGANASKTRFLAAASHDLLQPLNAARLFIGAIDLDAPKGREKAGALLPKIDRSIEAADELLKGLLDISRLDHADVTPRPEAVPLGPLLEDLLDEAAPMASEAGITLRLVPTSLMANADPDFLMSIVRNFLSNARRYTQTGGVVLGARRKGDSVRIEVWDSGPGIEAELKSRMFEEFSRGEGSDNRGLRGAGLGLSVVKRLAESMNAGLNVRSWPRRGSCFAITLPRARLLQMRPLRRNLPVLEPMVSLQDMRVLVLDDERAIRESMTLLLRGWGCRASAASTLDEARAMHAELQPEAVLVDYQLQREERGTQFLRDCQKAGVNGFVSAVITADNSKALHEETDQLGTTIFQKPVDPAVIKRFLQEARQAR